MFQEKEADLVKGEYVGGKFNKFLFNCVGVHVLINKGEHVEDSVFIVQHTLSASRVGTNVKEIFWSGFVAGTFLICAYALGTLKGLFINDFLAKEKRTYLSDLLGIILFFASKVSILKKKRGESRITIMAKFMMEFLRSVEERRSKAKSSEKIRRPSLLFNRGDSDVESDNLT